MRKKTQYLIKMVPLEFIIASAVFLVCLFIFSFIVHEAVFEREDVFDNNAIHFFSEHSSPALIAVMKRVTFFGSTNFLFPAYIVLIAWYISKKEFQYALDISVIAISSTAMMFALKTFFHRHRPAMPIIKGISGYSFPSGHALSSFIFCTILGYLVWKGTWTSVQKYCLLLFLLLCPLAIGLSRIILNVHYATDVIGGFCLGTVWVILSFSILKKLRKNTQPVSQETAS